MKYLLTEHFKKQIRQLEKRFHNVKNDLQKSLAGLNVEDEVSIGKSIYKVRIKSSDLKTGKSGGFRSYIYLFRKNELLVPLCIYFKGDKENISSEELQYHFDESNREL